MNFKRIFISLLMIMSIVLIGCSEKKPNVKEVSSNKEKIQVAVSIVPQETFVKEVGGDLVEVITMIPPGNSPENYQPSPSEMVKFSNAKIYFGIGVPTEKVSILPKAGDFNKNMKIVSLEKEVEKLYPHIEFKGEHSHDNNQGTSCSHDGVDPHIWMSPKRVKVMIETIKNELIAIDARNKETYEANAKNYIEKLDKVDKEIKESLKGFKNQSFIIYHPSFGYFAEDYNLNMIAIEEGGKEATAKKLKEVIDIAKAKKIKFVFYQEEFDSLQAETIAKEIGGGVVKVAPLAPDYIENLEKINEKFKEVLKGEG